MDLWKHGCAAKKAPLNLLEQICADKRLEIAVRQRECPLDAMRGRALASPLPAPFEAALRARSSAVGLNPERQPIGLIAEVKRRSPSVGSIREPFVPAEIARAYASAGADCLSVLVDGKYFGGGEDAFREVRAAVSLPLLYKEFVVDPWQVWHARAIGASAVLLIVSALTDAELVSFTHLIREAGLEALVEVHDAGELTRAAALGVGMIGVNNRNLKTFVTDLGTTEALATLAPAGCTLVGESGIRHAADVDRLVRCGAHAILVGEHLLRKPDLSVAVRELLTPV